MYGNCRGHETYSASRPAVSAPMPSPVKFALVAITVARDLLSSAISSASHAVPVPAPIPIANPLRIRPT